MSKTLALGPRALGGHFPRKGGEARGLVIIFLLRSRVLAAPTRTCRLGSRHNTIVWSLMIGSTRVRTARAGTGPRTNQGSGKINVGIVEGEVLLLPNILLFSIKFTAWYNLLSNYFRIYEVISSVYSKTSFIADELKDTEFTAVNMLHISSIMSP